MSYDKYYQTENLFGNPYPELIEFFKTYPIKGKVLDLGSGQGRDAISIARLGYSVIGIDNSKVGIEQMNHIANIEKLSLVGKVDNIFEFENFKEFDFILLDSMFHFAKKDRINETDFIKKIISKIKKGCIIIFCVQDNGTKVKHLNLAIDFDEKHERLLEKKIEYIFEDLESRHTSKTDYLMVVIKK